MQRLDRADHRHLRCSRVDAELSRAEFERIELDQMLSALVESTCDSGGADGAELALRRAGTDGLRSPASRAGSARCSATSIANAMSCCPPGGTIRIRRGATGRPSR